MTCSIHMKFRRKNNRDIRGKATLIPHATHQNAISTLYLERKRMENEKRVYSLLRERPYPQTILDPRCVYRVFPTVDVW